jgi:hypothetical protein
MKYKGILTIIINETEDTELEFETNSLDEYMATIVAEYPTAWGYSIVIGSL